MRDERTVSWYTGRTLCKTSSLNERGELQLNRHDFSVLYFCLENFSQSMTRTGVNFCGKIFALIFFAGI